MLVSSVDLLLITAQVDPSEFPRWIFDAFVWGVLVLIILGIIIGIVLLIQGRGIRKKAEEAGIEAPLPAVSRDLKPFGIDQGYWVCAGIILIVVAWVVAPIIRASFTENQIAAGGFLILAGVVWFFVFYGIIYIIREYPKRQRLLEEALRKKNVGGATPQKPRLCIACNEPLHTDEQFCSQCGASINETH